MAFDQFDEQQLFKTIDSTEIVKLGNFKQSVDVNLRNARVRFFLHNMTITTERFRINIVPKYDHPSIIYQSDWADLSNISNISAYWIGWIRFDFSDVFLDSDIEYFLQLEPDNYVRSSDANYIGVALDYHDQVNDHTVIEGNLPIGVEFYGTE